MPDLYSSVASLDALTAAWEEIANRPGDEFSDSLRRFAKSAPERLATITEQLVARTYRPGGLLEIRIPKESGDTRTLHVPTVQDRVVERAVLNVITPHVDPSLGPSSFAYRAGIGIGDAVQSVVRWRDEGHLWALRSDIRDCFPMLPRRIATRLLCAALPDSSLDDLIEVLVNRLPSSTDSQEGRGVAQGTPLSPFIANLLLAQLDQALIDRGFPVVRFADDFVVPCRSESDGWEAARVATGALEGLGMELSAEKTDVMSFATGFTFLGEDFGPVYPPVLDDHRTIESTRKVLYVGNQGSRVRKKGGRLVVESSAAQTLLDIPSAHVERVVLFGSVGLSAGAREWALANGRDVVFLSRKGSYAGILGGGNTSRRAARLRAQVETSGSISRSLGFARVAIAAKLSHQVTLLRRFPSRELADEGRSAVAQIQNCVKLTRLAQSRAELMGVEGAAAQVYFRHFGTLLPETLRFSLRTRRPPRDVANSALGYGYALLMGECVAALAAAGLDPAIGLLHSDEGRRPSLALDLMEEFRPYVVDQVVIELARRGSLTVEHGRPGDKDGGVLLTKEGKVALVDGYEQRMLRMTGGALPGFRGTIRRHLYRQAQRLAAYVEHDAAGWTGLSWR